MRALTLLLALSVPGAAQTLGQAEKMAAGGGAALSQGYDGASSRPAHAVDAGEGQTLDAPKRPASTKASDIVSPKKASDPKAPAAKAEDKSSNDWLLLTLGGATLVVGGILGGGGLLGGALVLGGLLMLVWGLVKGVKQEGGQVNPPIPAEKARGTA